MVGDVGSAYLNANMPMDKPDKILHMYIDKNVADAIINKTNLLRLSEDTMEGWW